MFHTRRIALVLAFGLGMGVARGDVSISHEFLDIDADFVQFNWHDGLRAAVSRTGGDTSLPGGHVTVQLDWVPGPEDSVWIGLDAGLFGQADNWNPAGPPTTEGRAIFNSPADADERVLFDASYANARMLVAAPADRQSSQIVLDLAGNVYTLTHEWNELLRASAIIGVDAGSIARVRVMSGTIDARDCEIGQQGFGELTVDGGGVWMAQEHAISVGVWGSGMLNIFNGGRVQHGHGYAGQEFGGHGTINVSGRDPVTPEIPSFWEVSGWFGLGTIGQGDLVLTNGGRAEVGKCDMATTPDSFASALISGQASHWLLTSPDEVSLIVGQASAAGVVVSGGGSVQSEGHIHLGELADAVGSIELHQPGLNSAGEIVPTLVCYGNVVVGQEGTGTLQVLDDAWSVINDGALGIGTPAGAPEGSGSEVTVSGGASVLEISGTSGEGSVIGLEVGTHDVGSQMQIASGGQVNVEYIVSIGGAGGGVLFVDGDDSILVGRFQLEVGRDGVGEIFVTNGGRILVETTNGDPNYTDSFKGLTFVGERTNGAVTIRGAGSNGPSLLESWSQLAVGVDSEGGNGLVHVEQGGFLISYKHTSATDTAGIIGRETGTVGKVVVRDPDSCWHMPDGGLTVGWQGSGELEIQDGGSVFSQHATVGRTASGRGLVTLDCNLEDAESFWQVSGPLVIGGDLAGNLGGFANVHVGERCVVFADAATLLPSGTIQLAGGVMATGQGTVVSGVLQGTGTIWGEIVNLSGVVHPSDLGTGGSLDLALGDNYAQQVAGELRIDVIGEGASGRLNVFEDTDSAWLGGKLTVHIAPGYTPPLDSMYEIVHAGSGVFETFESYDLPMIDGGPVFEVLYSHEAVTLRTIRSWRCKADLDEDNDVDGDDVNVFVPCGTGPTVPVIDEGCRSRDLDGDNDVDVRDFGTLQRCWSGSDQAADPGCAG